jgi:hypothetical protein
MAAIVEMRTVGASQADLRTSGRRIPGPRTFIDELDTVGIQGAAKRESRWTVIEVCGRAGLFPCENARLLGFLPLPFAQAHPRAAAVLGYELSAARL